MTASSSGGVETVPADAVASPMVFPVPVADPIGRRPVSDHETRTQRIRRVREPIVIPDGVLVGAAAEVTSTQSATRRCGYGPMTASRSTTTLRRWEK